jgi:hypothetical protein
MDKAAAEETADAYTPVLQKMRDSATNPQDKEFYDTHLESLKTRNPTLVNNTMESVKARILEASKLTNTQRELQDPLLAPGILRKTATEGMSDIGKKMWEQYPQLQPGSPEYAAKATELAKSSAMNINMGDKWMTAADAEKMSNAQGQHPALPIQWSDPILKDYQVKTTQNQADIKQGAISSNFSSELNDMLFNPENGLYKDYGPETAQNKVTQTVKQNVQKYVQTNPKYQQAADYIDSNLAPTIKSLGTVGSLSEGDLERAKGLLPRVVGINIDTPTVAAKKMKIFDRLVAAANQANANGTPVGITPEMLNGALTELHGGKPKAKTQPMTPPQDTSYVDPKTVKFPDNFTSEMKAQYLKELDDYNKSGGK